MERYIDCCFLLHVRLQIGYLGDRGTDRREILHDGTYWFRTDLLPFWGRTARDPQIRNFGLNFGHLTANISTTVSRSVNNNNNIQDNVYGAVIMAEPLREFTQFI